MQRGWEDRGKEVQRGEDKKKGQGFVERRGKVRGQDLEFIKFGKEATSNKVENLNPFK